MTIRHQEIHSTENSALDRGPAVQLPESDFRSCTFPLTVEKDSALPPRPMMPFVPDRRTVPEPRVIGQSLFSVPATVEKATDAFRSRGSSSRMLPLTLEKLRVSSQSSHPIRTNTDPDTVLALTRPVVEIRTLPLTLTALTSADISVATTSPCTFRPENRTPRGTRTSNSTRARPG